MLSRHVLYELERSFVRPDEIEKRLELARLIREAQRDRVSMRERMLLQLSGLLISLGEYVKARSAPVPTGSSACQPMEY